MSTHLAVTTEGDPRPAGRRAVRWGLNSGKGHRWVSLILIALLVVVIILGRSATKRIKNLNRRRAFAEKEGIDVFDAEETGSSHG